MSETIYIGVGSNIQPQHNICKALDLLRGQIEISATSTCYRSAAIGRAAQDDFVNCVWQATTDHDAESLKFQILHEIEALLGRVRTRDRYADRPIDLDILLYGELTLKSNRIAIPDPDILDRNFIAIPLLELAPKITIPGTRQRLADQPITQQRDGLTELTDLTTQLREKLNHEH